MKNKKYNLEKTFYKIQIEIEKYLCCNGFNFDKHQTYSRSFCLFGIAAIQMLFMHILRFISMQN